MKFNLCIRCRNFYKSCISRRSISTFPHSFLLILSKFRSPISSPYTRATVHSKKNPIAGCKPAMRGIYFLFKADRLLI